MNVDNMECTCRKWGISGIPCLHSLAAMKFLNLSVDQYITHYFTKSSYEEIYCLIIYPVNGQHVWEITPFLDVLPPLKRILLGRPKKKRRLQASELKKDDTQVIKGEIRKKCAICKQLGHNRTTCPQAPPSPLPSATFDQGQNQPHEQYVPPTQASTSDEGQNLPTQQFVPLTQPSTSNQFVPPTQPSSSDEGANVPPSVIWTQASTSTEPRTTQESIPPVPAHPTTITIPPLRPPSRGKPNIRPKLQHRRGRVCKP